MKAAQDLTVAILVTLATYGLTFVILLITGMNELSTGSPDWMNALDRF